MDRGSIHRILTKDLHMKNCVPSRVSTLLSEKNKKDRMACCRRILKMSLCLKVISTAFKSDSSSPGCNSTLGHMNTVTKKSYMST